MLRYFFVSFMMVSAGEVLAKDVYDAKFIISCSIGAHGKNAVVEEISVEVKKIDWNKDPAKPPQWGSMSGIKVKVAGNEHNASLLISSKNELAFSYAISSHGKNPISYASVYELEMPEYQIKKTVITLFSKSNNSIVVSSGACKRI